MAVFSEIDECRACGSSRLSSILSLGELFVSNFVDSENDETIRAPLELVLCANCSLLQLRHTVSSQAMYRNYWYRSGMNKTMMLALADIASKAEQLVQINENDIALDIGCNDGTLLRSYGDKRLKRVGFEPAINLLQYAEKETTKIINDFFNFGDFQKNFPQQKAKIITSIAMFYDLDNPNKFVADVVKCLHHDGVWVIEMHYLPKVLSQNAFDAVCHEHLEIYSLLSLENLLKTHDLEAFDIELNEVNGGSFRVYVKHKSGKIKPFKGAEKRLAYLRKAEKGLKISEKKIYLDFASRVERIKDQVGGFIKREALKGKKIFVYGASTKGNTLLQYFGLDWKLITAAAERNPDKWGKKTVGTLIPIVSEEQARAKKPDYFLVLPWHFLKEFTERESQFLESGGKFIVPLPKFRIIGYKT